MKLSDIFKFKLFEGGDKANLKIVNENFDIVEQELSATNKEITEKVTEINNKITELNNLLGGKLDVSKIANNLVTTEEGYALDARMGKVLSEAIGLCLNGYISKMITGDTNVTLNELTGVFFIDGWHYNADNLPVVNGMGILLAFRSFDGRRVQIIIGTHDSWIGHIYIRSENPSWHTI